MIPQKNRPIAFPELIFTALVLTSSLLLLEKHFLGNGLSASPVINIELEQVK